MSEATAIALTGPERNDPHVETVVVVEVPHTTGCACCRVLREALETQRRLLSERQALERQLRAAGRATVELQRVLGQTPREFCESEERV